MRRLEVLGVTEYHGGADNKCTILDGMRKRMSLEWQEIAYLGDDWVDLAPMSRVGLPVAVANAMPDVKNWRSS
ncbi:MAG: HAD hydrolase family protein [Bilophila wadsworthia]